MRKSQRLSTALAIGLLAYAGRADAANMYADFNAYPSNERLLNTNYGSGWPPGFGTTAEVKWGEDPADGTSGGTSVIQTSSTSGDLIAPSATGYNLSQPVVTAARSVIGTGTAPRRQNRATGGLTGDIWMSWLMAPSANARLGLNLNGSVKGFDGSENIRLIAVGSSFNVYGPGTISQPGVFTAGETALILGLLHMDATGTDDRMRLWVNPNVGLGEADVLANQVPIHDVILDNTIMGSSLNTVGVVAYSATSNAGYLDALRLSNEPTGFFDVTGVSVPEPTTALSMLAIGCVLGAAGLRRR
ncbi:MAG: PEP-CTERM sorting domain-containing protein [Planctomycetaceae bacterium]